MLVLRVNARLKLPHCVFGNVRAAFRICQSLKGVHIARISPVLSIASIHTLYINVY